MLTVKQCKKLLNKQGKKYTDQQVEQIRDFLWEMAQTDVEIFLNAKNKDNGKSSLNGKSKLR